MQNAKAELESCLEVIDALKEKENEYLNLINDYEKEKECYAEHVCQLCVYEYHHNRIFLLLQCNIFIFNCCLNFEFSFVYNSSVQ